MNFIVSIYDPKYRKKVYLKNLTFLISSSQYLHCYELHHNFTRRKNIFLNLFTGLIIRWFFLWISI